MRSLLWASLRPRRPVVSRWSLCRQLVSLSAARCTTWKGAMTLFVAQGYLVTPW